MTSKLSLGPRCRYLHRCRRFWRCLRLRRRQKCDRAGRRRQRQEGLHPVLRQVPHPHGGRRARDARAEPRPRRGHATLRVVTSIEEGVGGIQAEYVLRNVTFSQVYDVAKYVVTLPCSRRHARRSRLGPAAPRSRGRFGAMSAFDRRRARSARSRSGTAIVGRGGRTASTSRSRCSSSSANGDVPEHSHANEQVGILIEGSVTFRIGDETAEVEPGGIVGDPRRTSRTRSPSAPRAP